ncbi:facilitated trehalose transporter Tret1-like [Panulirus ornatus]|uniref:facilitated trehalose transporter Tret1-like n=1 Tax=Panulirus ornatus TaxID=150431 RepID=UPI003A88BCE1
MFLFQISPIVRQVVASTSASWVMMAIMTTWSFSTIALPQMALPGSPINFTTEQASWFASMPFITNIPGCLVSGPLCEWVGPRRLMLSLAPVLCLTTALMGAASWRLLQKAVAPEVFLLIVRTLQGGVQALIMPIVYVYIYEVCDTRHRGTLISLLDFWGTLSSPVCCLAGCYLDWATVAQVMSALTFVPSLIGLLLSPESPAWMLKKGRETEALKSLAQLRSSEDEIRDEVKVITESSQNDGSFRQIRQLLRKRSNVLATVYATFMLVFKELTGISVVFVFMLQIFQMSGVGLDPCLSSVIAGVAQCVFKGLASLSIHYLPRKPLLLVGIAFSAAATGSLGAFFFMKNSGEDVSRLEWLPLLSVVVFMVFYAWAVGPTTWTATIEALPGPMRSIGFSFAAAWYSAVAFTLSMTFENGEPAITLHGMFWVYAAGSIAYGIFIIIFVKETYGCTLSDIESYWQKFDK